MEKVVLGFGSNAGNRYLNIKRALKDVSLSGDFSLIAVSHLYETEPWGFKNQRSFLNCIAVGLTRQPPGELFISLKKIERKIGRKNHGLWREREIDIDILFYGKKIIWDSKLNIPHPQIQNRRFALIPLNEIMPEFVHPMLAKKIKTLLNECKDKGKVERFRKKLI